jgi:HK97 family phage major capsid protein
MATPPRPYSFTKLINSLSSASEIDNTTSWERGLGERCGKLFNQTLNRSQREQGCFIPPARMVRDLLTTPASAGGDLIATSVMKVAESVRPLTILESAGVQRLEVSGDNLTMPRFAEAAAGWIGEGESYPALATTTVSLDATPRMAAARLKYSRRLRVLAEDVESIVLQEVGRAVSSLIEAGCMTGSGTNKEPLGLLNLPGRLSQTFASATPSSAELAQMLEKLGDAKVDLNKVAFLMHPSTAADLMQTEVSANSGQLVLAYSNGAYRIHGRPVFISTTVTEDKVVAMDPSFSRLVYFGAAQIVTDPYSGALNGETTINVLNAVDFVTTYQSSVCVGSA